MLIDQIGHHHIGQFGANGGGHIGQTQTVLQRELKFQGDLAIAVNAFGFQPQFLNQLQFGVADNRHGIRQWARQFHRNVDKLIGLIKTADPHLALFQTAARLLPTGQGDIHACFGKAGDTIDLFNRGQRGEIIHRRTLDSDGALGFHHGQAVAGGIQLSGQSHLRLLNRPVPQMLRHPIARIHRHRLRPQQG